MSQAQITQMDEYKSQIIEVEQLIGARMDQSEQKKKWDYQAEVKHIIGQKKFQYRQVTETVSVGFKEDMKQLIFDPIHFPADLDLFKDEEWQLGIFEEKEKEGEKIQNVAPRQVLARTGDTSACQKLFGRIIMDGRISIKFHQPSYFFSHYELRERAIFFYDDNWRSCDKDNFSVVFTEVTFNYLDNPEDYLALKYADKVVKIKKDHDSRILIQTIEQKLLFCTFKGAYMLRNEVPNLFVLDFLQRKSLKIGSIDFVHEKALSEIANSTFYREAVGGFFTLLEKECRQRDEIISGEITYPKWLKQQFKLLPKFILSLTTNVIPTKTPLMHLKIKVDFNEMQAFSQTLKYIFPFSETHTKRTLVVYESALQDEQVRYMMNQISFPMYAISLPKNQLSLTGLEIVITASSILSHEVIDLSYNAKLMSLGNGHIFKLLNDNPSVKKLILKGCIAQMGNEEKLFENFTSSMCLRELQISYADTYNEAIIDKVANYDIEMC